MPRLPLKYWRFGIKPSVFLISLIPIVWLVLQWRAAYAGMPHALGFNPYEFSNRFTGDWALRFLLIGLAISPLAKLGGLSRLMLLRRMIGLFAAFYALMHAVSYVAVDLSFDWPALWKDILKRTYITVGMTALLLLIPLSLTSFNKAVKWMGARSWQRLHNTVYVIALLAVLHFIMMRKGFQLEPLIYAIIAVGLILSRLVFYRRRT